MARDLRVFGCLFGAGITMLSLGFVGCGDSSVVQDSSSSGVLKGKAGAAGAAGAAGKTSEEEELGGSGGEGGEDGESGSAGEAGNGAGAGGSGAGGSGQGGSAAGANSGQGGTAGADNEPGGSGGSNDGTGGTGGDPAAGAAGTGSAGSPPTVCDTPTNIDNDGDGYSEEEGDCNDCDPNVNPGAYDMVNVDAWGNPLPDWAQLDEDCDGSPTLPGQDVCDAGLSVADGDPIHGAFAMDICKVAQNGSWGIVKAEYVQLNGAALPNTDNARRGYGILSGFGGGTTPRQGERMFSVSSGTARQPSDPGYSSPSGFQKGYSSSNPSGFPLESPACKGVTTGTPFDSVGLRLTLKVPTNAKSFSFKFRFFTFEYPGYICSKFNDFFAVLMDPPPADVNATNKNITFDSQKNPVSVNNAFLEVCSPGNYGGKSFSCPYGTGDLTGTGFEGHGGTAWLQTQATVTPGSTITLTFGAYDSGDAVLDSTGIIDDFRWSAEPAQGTSTDKPLATNLLARRCVARVLRGPGRSALCASRRKHLSAGTAFGDEVRREEGRFLMAASCTCERIKRRSPAGPGEASGGSTKNELGRA